MLLQTLAAVDSHVGSSRSPPCGGLFHSDGGDAVHARYVSRKGRNGSEGRSGEEKYST